MSAAGPPELWLFVLANLLVLGTGGGICLLSYRAYARTGRRQFLQAAAGFAAITLGALVEAIYELGIRGSYELGGRELLALHTVEGVLIAAGLGALFFSLRQY